MKYWRKSVLIVIIAVFGFVLFFGFMNGLYYLFIFPILFISAFLAYYLHKQIAKDEEEQFKKGVNFATDDIAAEKWIEMSLAPQTLSYAKTKRKTIIIYSFFLVSVTAFVWSYLSYGWLTAVKNFVYAALLFWMFVFYVMTAPPYFTRLEKYLPEKIRNNHYSEWIRAYFFLLPITFLIYLLFPFETIFSAFFRKILTFPLVLMVYSFIFLALYSIVYFYEEMRKDDEKERENEVKKLIPEDKMPQ